MALKILYTIFIGILFAVFIGVGIAAFYPEPKYPEYPVELSHPLPQKDEGTESAKLSEEQIKYEKKSREFEKVISSYNRNVSMIAVVAAVLFVAAGLLLSRFLPVIPDGLLLGGLGTLIYSIVRGFNANDDVFRFIIVFLSLVITLLIGFVKFIKQLQKK